MSDRTYTVWWWNIHHAEPCELTDTESIIEAVGGAPHTQLFFMIDERQNQISWQTVQTRHQNHNRWSHGGSKRKVRRSPNSVGFLWGPWMSVENFLVIEMFHSGQNWPTLPFLEPRLAKKMKTLWVRRIGSIYMCQVCFLERIVKVNLQHQ